MSNLEGLRNRPTQQNRYEDVEEAESVEELRQRLRQMKALVNDRPKKKGEIIGIDDGFLSVVFGLILLVIGFVTLYAFYNLYAAVYRRWYPPA